MQYRSGLPLAKGGGYEGCRPPWSASGAHPRGGLRCASSLSPNSGRPFLEHARPHLADFLGGLKRLAFVTAASLADEAGYHERTRAALAQHLHRAVALLDGRPLLRV